MGFSSGTIRLVRTALIAASVLAMCSLSASASSLTVETKPGSAAGVVRGVVRDNGGNPIADASVAIFHSGTTKLLKQVTSARDGSFIARIIPGSYTILAVAFGFNPSYIFGVDVGRSADLSYGFKLEPAGKGNTLPEKRLDRNSSKWRIRAAQMQRAIYQNREGKNVADAAVSEVDETADERNDDRPGQTVVETYFSNTGSGSHAGINFATLIPINGTSDFVVAGQTGVGKGSPQRLETALKLSPIDGHQVRFNTSVTRIGTLSLPGETKPLGQVSFQALDEWKVREGIIVVYGVDYSRFVGAGDEASLTPRLGLQFDLNSRTRLRSSLTTQTEDRSWARALDLEGQNLAFSEPVAIEDLVIDAGKPKMNRSRRLEFGIERIIDKSSSIEANAFLDTTFGRGVGINSFAFDTLGDDAFGDFVANQQGRAHGIRVVYTKRLNSVVSASGGYAFGQGQRLSSAGVTDPASVFENDFFHSFFAQVAADLKTGTSVRTIYRLSPQATVFAVDPFKGRLAIYDPGLSVLVTQSLPNLGLPFRAEAIVDARNIFDFQSRIGSEEGGLRLTSFGRMLRGGIQVRF